MKLIELHVAPDTGTAWTVAGNGRMERYPTKEVAVRSAFATARDLKVRGVGARVHVRHEEFPTSERCHLI